MAGSTIHKHYSRGYQAALLDIVNAGIERADDPVSGMLTWIKNNGMERVVRDRADTLRVWTESE